MLPTYSGGWFLYANMGDHASSSSNVLWVALAEKAYAQMNEAGWLRPASWGGGTNSYDGHRRRHVLRRDAADRQSHGVQLLRATARATPRP